MTKTTLNAEVPQVWDPFVRLFHWSLVLVFLISQVTAERFDEIHEYAGYVIFGLISLRVVWGLIGPENARFRSFWPSPRAVRAHLGEVIRGKHTPTAGHNPAGGAMILALLATLLLAGLTGYAGQTDQFWGIEWIEETHEFFGNLSLILVGVHVTAVVLMSLIEKRNLIRAMVTGRYTAQSAASQD